MQLSVVSNTGDAGAMELADRTFATEFNEALVHQVVSAYMAGGRRGTKSRKSRAEVRGGGSKPWRQKGLGRARAGSIRSPIWRGGGAAFAAKPRSFRQKVNRKMYRSAMRAILSELIRQGRFLVVQDFNLEGPKTRVMVSRLAELGLQNVLIVISQPDETLTLASRNLHNVAVQIYTEVSPVSLLAFERVVMTVEAVRRIEERFA